MSVSQPSAKTRSTVAPDAPAASPAASAAGARTAEPCAIEPVWVSSYSRLWIRPPLTSAASDGGAPVAAPSTVAGPSGAIPAA